MDFSAWSSKEMRGATPGISVVLETISSTFLYVESWKERGILPTVATAALLEGAGDVVVSSGGCSGREDEIGYETLELLLCCGARLFIVVVSVFVAVVFCVVFQFSVSMRNYLESSC
jgi:hypothetical protein